MSTTDVKLYFTINADGEFEVGTEKDESEERFNDNIQTGGARITYAVEITDVELPDDPRTIRVSMKGATKETPRAGGFDYTPFSESFKD